jgi:hypothetical protein
MKEEFGIPAWVKCNACEYRFIFAYMPMESKMVRRLIKRLACPMCGNVGNEKFYICSAPKPGEDE